MKVRQLCLPVNEGLVFRLSFCSGAIAKEVVHPDHINVGFKGEALHYGGILDYLDK